MRAPLALSLLALGACGSGGSAVALPEALFADSALRARAEDAPELLREAESALTRARAAADRDEAADYATEARLLFLAAAAEGERRSLEPSAPGAPSAMAIAGVDDAEVRRQALAVALASTEAEAVTEAARVLEETRWRSREDALVSARRAALEVVVARTRVLLAALAGPVGLEATEVAALSGRLEEQRALRDPTAALDGVDRLRRELEARVTPTRGTAEVVAAAAAEGLSAEPIDGLWVVDLGAAAPPSADAVARAGRLVARLGGRPCVLVAEGAPRAPLERVLSATSAALGATGVDPAGVATIAVTSQGFAETRLSLRFLGYPPR